MVEQLIDHEDLLFDRRHDPALRQAVVVNEPAFTAALADINAYSYAELRKKEEEKTAKDGNSDSDSESVEFILERKTPLKTEQND